MSCLTHKDKKAIVRLRKQIAEHMPEYAGKHDLYYVIGRHKTLEEAKRAGLKGVGPITWNAGVRAVNFIIYQNFVEAIHKAVQQETTKFFNELLFYMIWKSPADDYCNKVELEDTKLWVHYQSVRIPLDFVPDISPGLLAMLTYSVTTSGNIEAKLFRLRDYFDARLRDKHLPVLTYSIIPYGPARQVCTVQYRIGLQTQFVVDFKLNWLGKYAPTFKRRLRHAI